eukprot:NODE_573_length_6556_cov_0.413040.p1 type:complete len:339 gc:universal NODE_573_length_6556_cov_0.413040:1169-2185(+)
MKLTLVFKDEIFSIDASEELEIDTLKMIVQAQLGVEQFTMNYNNDLLTSGTIASNKIKNEEIIKICESNSGTTQAKTVTRNAQLLQQFQQLLHQNQSAQQKSKDPIQENFEYAIEHYPEAFSHITMLFIQCQVNKVPIKCFVDSGAQATIISLDLAKRCELDHLIDKRFGGEARGVGTGKILGRIHAADMRIGDLFLTVTFTVMEKLDLDMLFGLDMLRRHQVVLDLNRNMLRIQEQEFRFLSEHEIPKGMFNPDLPTPKALSTSAAPSHAPLAKQINQAELGDIGRSIGQTPKSNAQFREDDIKTMIDLGATNRHHALQLLSRANGDLQIAASLLFH